MSWLRKLLVHLMLARPASALIKASGGAPRAVRGMTLDPRLQYIEARARDRVIDWDEMTVARLRAETEALTDLFAGAHVRGVRTQRVMMPGRNYSVPGRVYLPQVRDNQAAMLVYFHHGGGVVGSLETCHRLCALISRYAAAPVLSVAYRLAPEHPFPAGFEDALQAYQWGVENAGRFGAPNRKAAVGGDSIGGNFAALIAQRMKATRTPPALQLLIYPAVDLASTAPSMHDFADAFPLTDDLVRYFMERYLPEGADAADPLISPARASDLSGLAPALVYTAGFDMLLDQGEAYADRLQAAGVRVKRMRFDSLAHGFVGFPSASPAVDAALRRIARDTATALKSGVR